MTCDGRAGGGGTWLERLIDFESFYRGEYERVARGVLLSCGDRELAADAAQEAFKRAYVRWHRLKREPWVGGWAMTTAINFARREHGRRARLDQLLPKLLTSSTVAMPDPDVVHLVNALRRLPFKQRRATILYYWADLPVAAIAQATDVAEGTVRAQLHQARSALKSSLEEVAIRA